MSLFARHADFLVVLHDPADQLLARLHALDDDDADAVALLVHHEMNHAFLRNHLPGILCACPAAAASCRRSPRSAFRNPCPPARRRDGRASPRTRSRSASPRATRGRTGWCCGRAWPAALEPVAIPVRWEVAADEAMRRSSPRDAPRRCPSGRIRCTWSRAASSPIAGTGTASPPARRRAPWAARAPRPRPAPRCRACASRSPRASSTSRAGSPPTATWRRDDLDLVAFLGDYIYESSWGRDHVRKHSARRALHAGRISRALRALQGGSRPADSASARSRGSSPGTTTRSTTTTPTTGPRTACRRDRFLARRAAAYRAYYEHMPLPASMRPHGPDMRIYTTLDLGPDSPTFTSSTTASTAIPRSARREPGGSTVVDPSICTAIARSGAQHARRRAGVMARAAVRRFAAPPGTSSRSRR